MPGWLGFRGPLLRCGSFLKGSESPKTTLRAPRGTESERPALALWIGTRERRENAAGRLGGMKSAPLRELLINGLCGERAAGGKLPKLHLLATLPSVSRRLRFLAGETKAVFVSQGLFSLK